MPTWFLLSLLGLYGLVVGSFLNVVIVRVPSDESLLRPPSKCPMCETPIQVRDNIPVISWVLLRGKCRNCQEPIPVGYPLVELGNAVLWVMAGVRFGASWEVIPYAIFFSVLLALSVIDLELYILPNKITYPSVVASLVIVPAMAFLATNNPRTHIIGALIGMVGYAGGLLVVLLLWELIMRKEGMGMGDIKLAALLGLWLGYLSPALVFYSLMVASVLGLLVGGVILLVRRKSQPYPFGPWLAIGTIAVIMVSQPLIDNLIQSS